MNLDGKPRVWVNENWALNHPSHVMASVSSSSYTDSNNLNPSLRDEAEMIDNLITVIDQQTHNGLPLAFSSQLRNNAGSFRETRRFVNGFIAS